MSLASLDAWIKLYRPDENSPNTAISYYTKGAVVAFLLDAAIRRATGGARSLDDVMREAYRLYSGARGFTPAEFRALTERVAGADLGAFWRSAIEGTDELDYRTRSRSSVCASSQSRHNRRSPEDMARRDDPPRCRSSAHLQVRRHTPAFSAGLNVDDEIVAIDDVRVRADRLDERLEQYVPGNRVTVLVARRDRMLTLSSPSGPSLPKIGASKPR